MNGLNNDMDRGNYSQTVNERAKALVGMGKYSEARTIIEPQLEFARRRYNSAPDNQLRRLDVAEFLATCAASQERAAREERRRMLDEAQRLMDSLSPDLAVCEDPQIIVRYIASERAKLDRGE